MTLRAVVIREKKKSGTTQLQLVLVIALVVSTLTQRQKENFINGYPNMLLTSMEKGQISTQ